MIRLETIRPEHAAGLERLQLECFPTLGRDELMREAHFLAHCRVFPEGSFVLTDGARVVGLGSGFFTDFDFERPQHCFREIIARGYYTNHDPAGAWYYASDISVHPEYRGRGLGQRLYEARKALVARENRRGIVGGGVLPGYAAHRGRLSVPEYVEKVVSGELFDPTLSFQLKNGFEVRGLLPDYLEDSAADNWAALIVWENPAYDPNPS